MWLSTRDELFVRQKMAEMDKLSAERKAEVQAEADLKRGRGNTRKRGKGDLTVARGSRPPSRRGRSETVWLQTLLS